jgi:acyl dehydratase
VINRPTVKYLEDFRPGTNETIDGYLLTAEEMIDFAKKWDPQPMHTDPEAAKGSNYGGLIASGAYLMAIAVHQLVTGPVRVATIGALGLDEVRFLEPARPGDVISVTSECIETRLSNSKPDRGVVRNRITLCNQRGKTLLSYIDTLLVARRPARMADTGPG